jgi:hypothetical protein
LHVIWGFEQLVCVLAGICAEVQDIVTSVAENVVHNLASRIKTDDLMSAFQVLQPSFFQRHVDDDSSSFRSLAMSKVDLLASIYGEAANTADGSTVPALVDPLSLQAEFDSFFTRMESAAKHGQGTKEAWKNIFTSPAVSKHMKNYCVLARIMLCMPVTSVENERQFSLMNLLKDEKRNRLGSRVLNCLTRIKRSPYQVKTFPYEALLKEWLKAGRYNVDS